MAPEETDIIIDIVMNKLVQFAKCTQSQCEKCKTGKVTIECFNNHPGWVSISPHSIKRVLRKELDEIASQADNSSSKTA